MGLLDNILGNLTGGNAQTGAAPSSSTSPLTKALLLLLAAKAYQHYTSGQSQAQTPQGGALGGPASSGAAPQSGAGGGLGDLLRGGAGGGLLGGLAGGGLGGILGSLVGSGGLNEIVDRFRNAGHGDAVNSWIGTGQNQPIAPAQLGQALGPDTVQELAQHSGMSHDEVLRELAQELPSAVDQVTPEGSLPAPRDAQPQAGQGQGGQWI